MWSHRETRSATTPGGSSGAAVLFWGGVVAESRRGSASRSSGSSAPRLVEVIAPPRLRAAARALLKGKSPQRTPANAPATIRAKGRDDPLVDTATLRDAADAEIV